MKLLIATLVALLCCNSCAFAQPANFLDNFTGNFGNITYRGCDGTAAVTKYGFANWFGNLDGENVLVFGLRSPGSQTIVETTALRLHTVAPQGGGEAYVSADTLPLSSSPSIPFVSRKLCLRVKAFSLDSFGINYKPDIEGYCAQHNGTDLPTHSTSATCTGTVQLYFSGSRPGLNSCYDTVCSRLVGNYTGALYLKDAILPGGCDAASAVCNFAEVRIVYDTVGVGGFIHYQLNGEQRWFYFTIKSSTGTAPQSVQVYTSQGTQACITVANGTSDDLGLRIEAATLTSGGGANCPANNATADCQVALFSGCPGSSCNVCPPVAALPAAPSSGTSRSALGLTVLGLCALWVAWLLQVLPK